MPILSSLLLACNLFGFVNSSLHLQVPEKSEILELTEFSFAENRQTKHLPLQTGTQFYNRPSGRELRLLTSD